MKPSGTETDGQVLPVAVIVPPLSTAPPLSVSPVKDVRAGVRSDSVSVTGLFVLARLPPKVTWNRCC